VSSAHNTSRFLERSREERPKFAAVRLEDQCIYNNIIFREIAQITSLLALQIRDTLERHVKVIMIWTGRVVREAEHLPIPVGETRHFNASTRSIIHLFPLHTLKVQFTMASISGGLELFRFDTRPSTNSPVNVHIVSRDRATHMAHAMDRTDSSSLNDDCTLFR
jgi:hypothetical protein